MTREEVIDLWGKANGWSVKEFNVTITELERFAALAAAAEREACARVCESEGERIDASWMSCATAIRARGETK